MQLVGESWLTIFSEPTLSMQVAILKTVVHTGRSGCNEGNNVKHSWQLHFNIRSTAIRHMSWFVCILIWEQVLIRHPKGGSWAPDGVLTLVCMCFYCPSAWHSSSKRFSRVEPCGLNHLDPKLGSIVDCTNGHISCNMQCHVIGLVGMV